VKPRHRVHLSGWESPTFAAQDAAEMGNQALRRLRKGGARTRHTLWQSLAGRSARATRVR